MPWAAALWLTVAVACLAGPIGGRWLLDRLAISEPEPDRQAGQIALEVSRLLLAPEVPPGSLVTLRGLWTAAPSLGANDFLYGALLAEHAGHPIEARLWLAMEALRRGDRPRASALLAGTGVDLPQVEALPSKGGAWLATAPLGRRMTEALGTH